MSPIDPKTLDKVRKLLRLGESDNEHEAATAAARAADLMAREGIELAHLEIADGETSAPIVEEGVEEGSSIPAWRGLLAVGCAASQGAETWCHKVRRAAGRSKLNTATLIFCGSRAQVDAASYLFRALAGEVDRLAAVAYRREQRASVARGYKPPGARGWKNAFRVGCADMITKRLREQRQTTIDEYRRTAPAGSQALVHVREQDEALARYVARKGLAKGRKASVSSRGGYAAGQQAGKSVHIGGGRGLTAPAKRLGSGR